MYFYRFSIDFDTLSFILKDSKLLWKKGTEKGGKTENPKSMYATGYKCIKPIYLGNSCAI